MHDYNSSRNPIVLREYGRNIQELIAKLSTISDPEERAKQAKGILGIMSILDDTNKKCNDSMQKRWSDLFVIADFKLELEGPYPVPEQTSAVKELPRLSYNKQPLKFRSYGRNIVQLIEQTIQIEDVDKKDKMILAIVRLMKACNTEKSNGAVLASLKQIAEGKLDADIDRLVAQNSFPTGHSASRSNHRKKRA